MANLSGGGKAGLIRRVRHRVAFLVLSFCAAGCTGLPERSLRETTLTSVTTLPLPMPSGTLLPPTSELPGGTSWMPEGGR